MGLYGTAGQYCMHAGSADKVVFSYLHYPEKYWQMYSVPPKQDICFTNLNDDYLAMACLILYEDQVNGFIPAKVYSELIQKIKNSWNNYKVEEKNSFSLEYYIKSNSSDDRRGCIQKANTIFMFNYEDAPNQGYFLINNFNRGGQIERPPYAPQREGYKFAGWYKETECRNVWDFTKNTLPEAEYDDQGNLIFIETMLYAKWTKK